jgi:hypothetical protein
MNLPEGARILFGLETLEADSLYPMDMMEDIACVQLTNGVSIDVGCYEHGELDEREYVSIVVAFGERWTELITPIDIHKDLWKEVRSIIEILAKVWS